MPAGILERARGTRNVAVVLVEQRSRRWYGSVVDVAALAAVIVV